MHWKRSTAVVSRTTKGKKYGMKTKKTPKAAQRVFTVKNATRTGVYMLNCDHRDCGFVNVKGNLSTWTATRLFSTSDPIDSGDEMHSCRSAVHLDAPQLRGLSSTSLIH